MFKHSPGIDISYFLVFLCVVFVVFVVRCWWHCMFKHSPGIDISYYLVLLCAANVAADVRLCSIPYIPERECVLGPLYTCLGSQTHPSSLWRRCPCASFDPPSVPILEQASC